MLVLLMMFDKKYRRKSVVEYLYIVSFDFFGVRLLIHFVESLAIEITSNS